MRRREFAALAASAAASCTTRRQAQAGPPTVVVAATPYLTMSPLYLAIERKYFERAGLNIQLERLSNASAGNAALAGGKLDVSFVPLNAGLINAVAKGARLRVVAGREHLSPDCSGFGGMLIRRKSFPRGLTLANLGELRGKKISALGANTGVVRFFIDKVLEHGGLTDKDLQFVSIDNAEEPIALSRGLIDLASNPVTIDQLPPAIAAQVDSVKPIAHLMPGFQASVVLFGQRLVDGDPSVGARFLAAYQRAVREYTRGEEPEFFREYARKARLDLEALRKNCRSNVSLDGKVDLNSIQTFIDWSVARGFATRAIRAAEIVDSRFVDQAGQLPS